MSVCAHHHIYLPFRCRKRCLKKLSGRLKCLSNFVPPQSFSLKTLFAPDHFSLSSRSSCVASCKCKAPTSTCLLAPLKSRPMVEHNAKPGFTGSDAKQENDPGGQNGTTLRIGRTKQWTLFQYGVLDLPKWARAIRQCKNLFGLREAISYAVIIYSSLGMEEGAFTGVINIFGAQLCSGLLSTCQPTLIR